MRQNYLQRRFDREREKQMSDLQRAVKLAELLRDLESKAAGIEAELLEVKAAANRIKQETLPELMRELGVLSFGLEDGSTVKVSEDITCRITEAQKQPAMAWLIDNGLGGIIKTKVVSTFDRGDIDVAARVAMRLEDDGLNVDLETKVEPGTLKSTLKELLENGANVPFELFNIHAFSKASFTKSKTK